MNPRLVWVLALLLLLPAAASAGNNTYCVAAPGPFFTNGACGSPEAAALHHAWHFHVYVSDGTHCHQCFDERDNTCETDFLSNNPGWLPISAKTCLVIGPPDDDAVRFHVIAGKDVAAPPKPPAPSAVSVRTEVSPRTRGPYAVGDEIAFDVRAEVGPGQLRPFDGGHILLVDEATGQQIARVPVIPVSEGRGEAVVALPSAGRLRATFEPGRVGLPSTETEARRDMAPLALDVGACRLRATPQGPAGALLLGGDALSLRAVVHDLHGATLPPSTLSGRSARFVLQRADGSEIETPATITPDGITGTLRAPSLPAGTEAATAHFVVDGTPPVCAGPPVAVTLSHLPLTLTPAAPDSCWTDRACDLRFELGRPSGGAALARANQLLAEPGLEVLARLGGQRVQARRQGDTFVISSTPAAEGRIHADLELLWSGARSLTAEASVDVRESIELVLPESVDLGEVSGGDLAETCASLSFSAGAGTLGSTFSVELAEPCGECEAQLVSVAGGQVYDLPLEGFTIGLDQSLPLCLRVARCPTGPSGGTQELIVRPTEPLFADQARRVSVSYRVSPRGLLDCWRWPLRALALALALAAVGYGFVRPESFEPGSSVRIAGSEKGMRRAPRLLLEEQPGGRAGWYRSARVRVDPGGAATSRKGSALLTFVPSAGGVAVRSPSGVLRQDRRTRRMEPVPDGESRAGVPLQRGRIYQIGDLLIRVGG